MRRSKQMNKPEILELPSFEYTPQGFRGLKATLKEGKTVRNPFAKFYGEKIEVNVIKDSKAE
jgi:hypothetical protein